MGTVWKGKNALFWIEVGENISHPMSVKWHISPYFVFYNKVMSDIASAPIGIFDSGIGGRTVARAVKNVLPNEQIIYFGDTAHPPYGDKSTAAIQPYAVKMADVLLKANCKLILIACNSASTAAFELVKAYVASNAGVFNVIDPVVNFLRESQAAKKVGLIGTKQTVKSGVYHQKVNALGQNIQFVSLATPLLAPMIEEGFHKNEVSHGIIRSYLEHADLKELDALILGCTHYPLIKQQIDNFYGGAVEIIDSSEIVANATKAFLELNHLLNQDVPVKKDRFLV